MEQLLSDVLEGKAKINSVDQHDQNALFFSDVEQTKQLLEMGINVNHVSSRTENALFSSNYDKSKLLIEAGININHINSRQENSLFFADADKIKLLIEAGIDVNQTTWYGRNAAFRRSGIKTTELLVNAGINFQQVDKESKNILFHVKQLEEFKLLIEKGIDIHQVSDIGNLLFSPNVYQNTEILQYLIKNTDIDVNHLNSDRQNILFRSYTDCDTAKLLIEKGINIQQRDRKNETCLRYVDYETCKLLVENGIVIEEDPANSILYYCNKDSEKLLFLLTVLDKKVDDNLISKLKNFYAEDIEVSRGLTSLQEKRSLNATINVEQKKENKIRL